MKPTLHTKRFTLIPWNNAPDHNQHLTEMMQDERVQKYIRGHAFSNQEVIESFEKLRKNSTDHFGTWMIYQAETCIGIVILKQLPTTKDIKLLETGYWVKPQFWGQKIAAEVATRIIKYGFDELNLPEIVAVTHEENIASQKSLKKAGLTRQGHIDAYDQNLPFFKIENPNFSTSSQPTITTERFRLIPWRHHAEHNAHLTELLKSEKVQKYVNGKPHSDAEIIEGLPKMHSRTNKQRGFGMWMIYNDEECVGIIFLKSTPSEEPLPYEIGYWLKPKFWGQGIAAEVASQIVKYAFEQLNLPNIIGLTDVKNIASQKSLLKIGFTQIEDYYEDETLLYHYKINNPNFKKSNKPTLTSKRFTLLPWVNCPEFAQHMTEMMQDADVQKYVYEHVLTDDEMHQQLTRMTNISQQKHLGYWMIYEADTCVGMALLKPAKSKNTEYRAEVGYWLKPAHWGKAIAAEAAATLIKYGFETIKLDAIEAITHPDNIGSQKSLLNAGLIHQGEIVQHGDTLTYFQLTKTDYENPRSSK